MLGRIRKHRDFWSDTAPLADVDLAHGPTLDDVTPGGGDGWRRLWEGGLDAADDETWDAFLDGDAAPKREETWLLSA